MLSRTFDILDNLSIVTHNRVVNTQSSSEQIFPHSHKLGTVLYSPATCSYVYLLLHLKTDDDSLYFIRNGSIKCKE